MTADDVARFRREIVDVRRAAARARLVPRPAAHRARARPTSGSPCRPRWCGATATSRIGRGGAEAHARTGWTRRTSSSCSSGVTHWIPTQAPDGLRRRDPRAGARRERSPPTARPRRSRCRTRSSTTTATSTSAAASDRRVGRPGGARRGRGRRRTPDRADRLRPARRARGRSRRRGAIPTLVAGVALHPNEAPRLAAAGARRRDGRDRGARRRPRRVRAVGETGLDHFRTGPEGRAAQEESFRRHIDLAKRLDKTLVIHDRDAHEEVLRRPRRRGRARTAG